MARDVAIDALHPPQSSVYGDKRLTAPAATGDNAGLEPEERVKT
jgi:hypothetical protein